MKKFATICLLIVLIATFATSHQSKEHKIFADGFETGNLQSWNTHSFIGDCLILDDIAYFHPVFGTFVHLVFRPVGSSETITFVAAGTTGVGALCPPPIPTSTRLTFRIEPTVSVFNDNIVHYALEALDVSP